MWQEAFQKLFYMHYLKVYCLSGETPFSRMRLSSTWTKRSFSSLLWDAKSSTSCLEPPHRWRIAIFHAKKEDPLNCTATSSSIPKYSFYCFSMDRVRKFEGHLQAGPLILPQTGGSFLDRGAQFSSNTWKGGLKLGKLGPVEKGRGGTGNGQKNFLRSWHMFVLASACVFVYG